MLNISGRQTGRWYEYGYATAEQPVFLSCAGYQEILTKDHTIHRPQGRKDYQLLYLVQGKGTFFLDEAEPEHLAAGTMLLFRPGEPQCYCFLKEEHPRLYWMHFTGGQVEQLLQQAGLNKKRSLYLGVREEITGLFSRIIRELQEQPPMFETYINSCFQQLLAVMCRLPQGESGMDQDISRVIKEMHLSYRQQYRPEIYAGLCGLSPQSFIHKFTKNTGVSPGRYLVKIRMEEASRLLQDTGMSIQEVGAAVGYENPLYFSRVFSSWAGCSPRQYREQRHQGTGFVQ